MHKLVTTCVVGSVLLASGVAFADTTDRGDRTREAPSSIPTSPQSPSGTPTVIYTTGSITVQKSASASTGGTTASSGQSVTTTDSTETATSDATTYLSGSSHVNISISPKDSSDVTIVTPLSTGTSDSSDNSHPSGRTR